ncbi:hypothetical protein [Oleiagrimonas sp.]|jgi:uncharacterized membrane protein YphA (DoxX/SURF4 family)|uniref:hypothetical protein n=1 Tax=Oleiagrimonas sp. TaxID=2010330 RepID=UPI00260B7333|nr:hypothetical protein [Oleiagrimonas sp.]MDA3914281.1 hypothetical protein [Oleiagrimonas sp.]
MRIVLLVIGIILVVASIWVLAGNGSYSSTETVVSVGSHALKATEDKAIPLWVGISGLVVGGVLILVGLIRGKR